MNRKQVATVTMNIHASDAEVWEALVNPELISQYLHGTKTETTWLLHSPITFSGEWEGRPYVDKGEILEINPLRVLSYSYWSPLSGTEDFEDNYAHVTFHLSPFHEHTVLTITQDNLEEDEDVVKAEGNWMKVASDIKHLVERTPRTAIH